VAFDAFPARGKHREVSGAATYSIWVVINLGGGTVEMPRDERTKDWRIQLGYASMTCGNITAIYIPLLWLRVIPGCRVRLRRSHGVAAVDQSERAIEIRALRSFPRMRQQCGSHSLAVSRTHCSLGSHDLVSTRSLFRTALVNDRCTTARE